MDQRERIADHQCHWFPPAAVESLARRRDYPRAERVGRVWVLELAEGHRQQMPPTIDDLEAQFADADAHGIDVLVSSPNHLGEVLHLEPSEAAEHLDLVNELVAAAQREHPARFVGLAMLPMQDPELALGVLDRAAGNNLRGVTVVASIDGRSIARDELLPVYRRIEELRLPLFLHPGVRSNTFPGSPLAEAGLGWMYHTTLAAVNLIESGVLDACPDLVVVHPHLGGVLPYVLDKLLGV